MKNHRIFAKNWFKVGGIALVLGAVLLAMLLFNLPASAYPPEPTPLADSWQSGGPVREPGHIRLEGVEKSRRAPIGVPLAAQGWMDIMTEDFEGAFPGTKWTLYGDTTWGKGGYRPRNGDWSGYCAGGGTNSVYPPGPYPDNMNAQMIYGPFDLSSATDAELRFYHWTKTKSGNDFFWLLASIDFPDWSGSRWSGDWAGKCGGWCEYNFDLTDVDALGNLCGQPEVWIAFVFTSNSSNTYEGTYVDDIALRAFVSAVTGTPTMTPTPTVTGSPPPTSTPTATPTPTLTPTSTPTYIVTPTSTLTSFQVYLPVILKSYAP